jgi:hypothetical protein
MKTTIREQMVNQLGVEPETPPPSFEDRALVLVNGLWKHLTKEKEEGEPAADFVIPSPNKAHWMHDLIDLNKEKEEKARQAEETKREIERDKLEKKRKRESDALSKQEAKRRKLEDTQQKKEELEREAAAKKSANELRRCQVCHCGGRTYNDWRICTVCKIFRTCPAHKKNAECWDAHTVTCHESGQTSVAGESQ